MEPTEITHKSSNDTICAISTPAGVGGIAVCRVSGPQTFEIVARIWHGAAISGMKSHTAHLGTVDDSHGEPLDQAVLTVFHAPNSFTGENVAEIAVHGSRYVQRELLASLIHAGARLAEAGEFTRRAFTAGKLDLSQAEAVADIIAADSRAAHRMAFSQMKGRLSERIASLRSRLVELTSLLELELDFSEEDVEFASRAELLALSREVAREVSRLHQSFASGNAIKNGIPVAIVGDTNAGKSSLLNLLTGDDRAIVSDIHGTTRDTIEDTIALGDYTLRLIDTAGIRDTADTIERIGIERSLRAMKRARIILLVADSTQPLNEHLLAQALSVADASTILVLNKSDLAESDSKMPAQECSTVSISALTGEGLDALQSEILRIIREDVADNEAQVMVTNLRHAEALREASEALARVIDALEAGISGDLVSQDLRIALHHLAAITGEIPSTEILSTIFSRFCIGK